MFADHDLLPNIGLSITYLIMPGHTHRVPSFKGLTDNHLPQLGQAALSRGVNFVLPILLAQVAPKIGLGGFSSLPTAVAAPAVLQATDNFAQVVNLNYFVDPMGELYAQPYGMPSMGTLTEAETDFFMSDWIMKKIENAAMPLVELVDIILDYSTAVALRMLHYVS